MDKETIKQLLTDGVISNEVAAKYCPELKESEDERIRKELLDFCKNRAEYYPNDPKYKNISAWIAWLEKQGEQKPVENSCKKSDDITTEEKDMTEYKKGFECGKQRVLKYPEDFDLCKKTLTAWSEEDELHIRELESLVKRVWAIAEHENDKDTIHEMSDLSFFLKTLKPQLKQEWSGNDEINYQRGICYVNNYINHNGDTSKTEEWKKWFKSLKDRVQPQPKQEWSEEDKKLWVHDDDIFLDAAKMIVEDSPRKSYGGVHKKEIVPWFYSLKERLKSLRPQSQWKPSEEILKHYTGLFQKM